MRKIVIMLLIVVVMGALSGCGLFETFGGANAENAYEYSDVYDLKSGKAYVWNPVDDETIYDDIKNMVDAKILMDSSKLNYRLYDSIPKSAEKVEAENPEIVMKCMKNLMFLKSLKCRS